ncbi:SHOCT domain-containing protein [Natrinema salinisoli]|uniref:SHOCT domain-containing protein n=1 Tax=Natrinema salinisoli TaxID=2878535 RepID=UPI001CF05B82|nr:SHOCT domain-containing protein [Natrinema salinisoli]
MLDGDDASESAPTGDAEPTPLEELKRRYAAGEIDEAEFERRLERLVAVDEIPDDATPNRPARARLLEASSIPRWRPNEDSLWLRR